MKQLIAVIFLICFLQPIWTASAQDNLKATEGKRLHLNILARHPKLDKIYQQPDLYGGLTASPKVTIYLPLEDWNNATSKERELLEAYVSSLIKQVKADPLKYTSIPTNTPAASQIKNNVIKMNNKSWQIIAGQISQDGKDIFSDLTVSEGQ